MRPPLQQQVIEQAEALLQQARDHYGQRFSKVEIRFDLRGGSAGQARLGTQGKPVIRFNNALLEQHSEAFIARTVPHEVAHVVAYQLCRGKLRPHGPEWAAVMQLFGAEPTRCHNYDLSAIPRRRMRRFTYHCGCRSHELTSIRHNRIQRGQRYYCKQCRQPLTPSKG